MHVPLERAGPPEVTRGSFNDVKHLRFDVLRIDGEFVTDSAMLDAIRALGVDDAQGFHLGRPAPVEQALRLARSGAGQRP